MSTTNPSQPDVEIPATSNTSRSASGDEKSSTCNVTGSSEQPRGPEKPPRRRKLPMRDFEWGGNVIRETLPVRTIPRWLDPSHVDVADPTELPLCWYGVPFVRSLIYPYAKRIGLASYHEEQLLRVKPGDLDVFQTWANMDVWFKKLSGLQLDLNLVWGQPTPILTFFSNHELPKVTKEQLDLISDFLDDMDYDEDELMWYLDRNLDY